MYVFTYLYVAYVHLCGQTINTYIYIYIYIGVCIYIYIYVYTYKYKYIYICLYLYTHAGTRTRHGSGWLKIGCRKLCAILSKSSDELSRVEGPSAKRLFRHHGDPQRNSPSDLKAEKHLNSQHPATPPAVASPLSKTKLCLGSSGRTQIKFRMRSLGRTALKEPGLFFSKGSFLLPSWRRQLPMFRRLAKSPFLLSEQVIQTGHDLPVPDLEHTLHREASCPTTAVDWNVTENTAIHLDPASESSPCASTWAHAWRNSRAKCVAARVGAVTRLLLFELDAPLWQRTWYGPRCIAIMLCCYFVCMQTWPPFLLSCLLPFFGHRWYHHRTCVQRFRVLLLLSAETFVPLRTILLEGPHECNADCGNRRSRKCHLWPKVYALGTCCFSKLIGCVAQATSRWQRSFRCRCSDECNCWRYCCTLQKCCAVLYGLILDWRWHGLGLFWLWNSSAGFPLHTSRLSRNSVVWPVVSMAQRWTCTGHESSHLLEWAKSSQASKSRLAFSHYALLLRWFICHWFLWEE